MNCEECASLLADALGGELAAAARSAFEEHLLRCVACRAEYESGRRAVEEMRSLSGPQSISLREFGLEPESAASRAHADERTFASKAAVPGARRGSPVRMLRLAASLLMAFTAGYAFHAVVTLSGVGTPATQPPHRLAQGGNASGVSTLEASFARVYAQQPLRSDLAKALMAMMPRR